MNVKYTYTKEQLETSAKQSINMRHLLELIGVNPSGGNYKTIQRRLQAWNIDVSHWGTALQRQGHMKGKTHNIHNKTYPLENILVKDYAGGTTSHKLKLRLLKARLFEKKCYNCNLTEWLGNPMPLELEHKNGDNKDNRIENLTLLCPNCHALTSTYRGKNKNGRSGGTRTLNPCGIRF